MSTSPLALKAEPRQLGDYQELAIIEVRAALSVGQRRVIANRRGQDSHCRRTLQRCIGGR
jgi:hypothetical protein